MPEINNTLFFNTQTAKSCSIRRSYRIQPSIGLVVLILAILMCRPVFSAGQESFSTANEAVKALSDALRDKDSSKLLNIFGTEYEDALVGGDSAAARVNRDQVAEAIQSIYELRKDGDGLILLVGPNAWPFPFPLVKKGQAWQFDTAAGIEEVVNRRIGENELNAIEMCRAYIDAQLEYSAKDRDGDRVLEYAQQIVSTPGVHNGLYWKEENDQDISPFGPLVSDAKDYIKGRNPGDPYKGYYYKILTRQSKHAPGGRYDYIVNGNMIGGFALISFPADYGNSGIMSFICSQQGDIFQADLGEDSDLIAGGMEIYNPDKSWTLVKNP